MGLVHNSCDVGKGEKFSRKPRTLQDEMTLEAAKKGAGKLMDFKFKKHSDGYVP